MLKIGQGLGLWPNLDEKLGQAGEGAAGWDPGGWGGETAPEDGVRLCDSPPGTQVTGLVLFNLSLLLSKEAGTVTYSL